MALDLYHHGSSTCAAKVRLALTEKRLAWTSHYVDILRGQQFEPGFLALNPKAVVPVLSHDGAVITESTVICEYLEECFPDHPIFPAAPIERARVREWTKAVDEELHPACSALTYIVSHRHTILRNGSNAFAEFAATTAVGSNARAQKWQWIQQGLDAPGAAEKVRLYDAYLRKMDRVLGETEWLAGDHFSMADIALAPYVNRLANLAMHRLWGDGRLPNVNGWFNRIRLRPAFATAIVEWLPPELSAEMKSNGESSWPAVRSVLGL